jgi:hypothetical protein
VVSIFEIINDIEHSNNQSFTVGLLGKSPTLPVESNIVGPSLATTFTILSIVNICVIKSRSNPMESGELAYLIDANWYHS